MNGSIAPPLENDEKGPRVWVYSVLRRLWEKSWIGALFAAVALWLLAGYLTGQISYTFLAQNAVIAGFLAIAGVAQMTVVASGPGNFDLSLPFIITLSAYVMSAGILGADNIFGSFVLALLVGLVAGAANALLIVKLSIPPIVATLASGYILYSMIVAIQSALFTRVSGIFEFVLRYRFFGVTGVLVVAAATMVLMGVVFTRTVYGTQLHAMGQNAEAARLAGIRRDRIIFLTFMISGVLASWLGVLLTTYQGGVTADLGSTYLLGSVAAVVVGGTRISGGVTSVIGTALGALVLTLATTDLILLKIGIGGQYLLLGLIVIVTAIKASLRQRPGH